MYIDQEKNHETLDNESWVKSYGEKLTYFKIMDIIAFKSK